MFNLISMMYNVPYSYVRHLWTNNVTGKKLSTLGMRKNVLTVAKLAQWLVIDASALTVVRK